MGETQIGRAKRMTKRKRPARGGASGHSRSPKARVTSARRTKNRQHRRAEMDMRKRAEHPWAGEMDKPPPNPYGRKIPLGKGAERSRRGEA